LEVGAFSEVAVDEEAPVVDDRGGLAGERGGPEGGLGVDFLGETSFWGGAVLVGSAPVNPAFDALGEVGDGGDGSGGTDEGCADGVDAGFDRFGGCGGGFCGVFDAFGGLGVFLGFLGCCRERGCGEEREECDEGREITHDGRRGSKVFRMDRIRALAAGKK
jgi:hypothetical protein